MKRLPTLYKLMKDEQIFQWSIATDGKWLITECGVFGKIKSLYHKECKTKELASRTASQKFRKKKEQGYTSDRSKIHD